MGSAHTSQMLIPSFPFSYHVHFIKRMDFAIFNHISYGFPWVFLGLSHLFPMETQHFGGRNWSRAPGSSSWIDSRRSANVTRRAFWVGKPSLYIYIIIYIYIVYIYISMVHQWIIIPKMLQTPRLRLYGWSCFLGSVYTFCFWNTRAWENGLKCHNQ